jgi:hypothetical protein
MKFWVDGKVAKGRNNHDFFSEIMLSKVEIKNKDNFKNAFLGIRSMKMQFYIF